jgi:DNA modification methylase
MSALETQLSTNWSLLAGDCVGVMRGMAADSVDLVVTSPPYDNLRTYNGVLEWDFESAAKELSRVLKPGGVIVWVVSDATVKGSETGTSFRQVLHFKDSCGLNIHDTMIWHKPNPLPLHHNRQQPSFEYMFILSKSAPKTFNPLLERVKGVKGGAMIKREQDGSHSAFNSPRGGNEFKYRHNVMNYAVGERSKHPAAFPTKLASDHVMAWSNPGDTVLDPFMGSGTTGVAAISLGRSFIGIDINPEYVKLAEARMQTQEN